MPAYRYRAIDAAGRAVAGQLAANDDAAVRSALLGRGLLATVVEPTGPAPALPFRRQRLSAKELALFTRQLATLAEVIPVPEALASIASEAGGNARAQVIIAGVQAGVQAGQSLSAALGQAPASFSPLYRALVAAGERAGALPQALRGLADWQDRQAALRSKLVAALAYPAALTVVALLAVALLMIMVVPRIAEQFADLGQALPLLTRLVVGTSALLAAGWWALALLAIAGLLLARRALAVPAVRLAMDRWLLALPGIGKMLRALDAARLARTLAMMLASRLPLLDALALTQPVLANHALRAALRQVMADVREGAGMGQALRRTQAFPPLLVTMVLSGDAAGRLDLMLDRAADALERETDAATATALAVLEPAIILVMGALVAVIVLSILLPILQLESLVRA